MIRFLDQGATKIKADELFDKIAFKMVMNPVPQLCNPMLIKELTPWSACGVLFKHVYDCDKPNIAADTFGHPEVYSRDMIVCLCDTVEEANELLDVSFRNVQEHSEFSTEKWQALRDMDGLEITPGPKP